MTEVWVALVLGVLSAIFALIWFRGAKEQKRSEPQKESEQVIAGESAAQQEARAPPQEDGGVERAKLSATISLGAQVQPGESVHAPGHSSEQDVQQVSGHVHEREKPRAKVILESIVKAKVESINPCQNVAPQIFHTTENRAPSTQKELGKKDSPEPLVTEVAEEKIIVPPECVFSLPEIPCEDQVVECELSSSVQTSGAITECQEREDAFPLHRSEGGNCNSIIPTEDMDSPVLALNGKPSEPVHSPEKIDLVRATISDAKLPDSDHTKIKRVAAVQPMSHNIKVDFKVHYITNSDTQWLAVTGNHEKLGGWETFVPLKSEKDGFWSHSAILPADTNVEWKFVMVENGKIKRWEECSNRSLTAGHDDVEAHEWWGYL